MNHNRLTFYSLNLFSIILLYISAIKKETNDKDIIKNIKKIEEQCKSIEDLIKEQHKSIEDLIKDQLKSEVSLSSINCSVWENILVLRLK